MTTVGGTGELKLLELIKQYLGAQAGGDDAAVLAETGPFTVLSTDMAVEGVHFDLAWMTAEDAGWRALALALGDLAAKGASPTWALTSVAVARSWKVDDFVGLFTGMHALAAKVGMAIEGGDMSAIGGPAVLSLTSTSSACAAAIFRTVLFGRWKSSRRCRAVDATSAPAMSRSRRERPSMTRSRAERRRSSCAWGLRTSFAAPGSPPSACSRGSARLISQVLRLRGVATTTLREVTTASAAETEALGEETGSRLKAGDLVLLAGPLGSGKTTFVRGVARGTGSDEQVQSPTFTLVRIYPGRVQLAHVDLYRVQAAGELADLGLDELLDEGAMVIEWGDRLELRHADLVTFENLGDDRRRLRFESET